MTDTFRALCVELHAAIQLYTGQNPAAAGIPANELVARLMDAMANTAAALARPEPVAPTDEELETTARAAEIQYMKEHGGLAGLTPDGLHAQLQAQRLAGLRAVAARFGRPAIEPVPVSKRLPRQADCDANGRCWLTSVDVEPGWVTDNPEQCTNWTHWLPHWALPVPGVEGADG
jgi:hypothetical protein